MFSVSIDTYLYESLVFLREMDIKARYIDVALGAIH